MLVLCRLTQLDHVAVSVISAAAVVDWLLGILHWDLDGHSLSYPYPIVLRGLLYIESFPVRLHDVLRIVVLDS